MWRGTVAIAVTLLAVGCGDDDRPRADRDAGIRPDAGPPPMTDGGPPALLPDPGELAAATVLLRSCVSVGGSSASLLMQIYGTAAPSASFAGLVRDNATCLATAGTGCDALTTCLGIEILPAGGECTPGCDGDTAVFCDGAPVRFLCTQVGLACDAASGTCVPPGTCTAPACDAGRALGCVDMIPDPRAVCSDYGLTCGAAGCTATGDACTTGSDGFDLQWFYDPATRESPALACDDRDTLSTCIAGQTHALACPRLASGMRCRMTTDVTPRFFCGLGTSCNPFSSTPEFCSGDTVPVCNAGRLENVDCLTLGFSRCALGVCE